VDKVISGPAGEPADHFNTAVFATRLDGPQRCALRLVFRLKQQIVRMDAGTEVRFAYRRSIRHVEEDVSVTTTLRSSEGELLLGAVTSVRPEVWDKDMLPELTLSVQAGSLCQESKYPTLQRLRFTLSSGTDTCTLDAATARCCKFSGKNHLVLAADALRTSKASGGSTSTRDGITVLVAREGLLAPAPR
jgi:hypothetical protein